MTHRGRKSSHSDSHEAERVFSFLLLTQVAHYVWNKAGFDAVDPETTDYLMGKFSLL